VLLLSALAHMVLIHFGITDAGFYIFILAFAITMNIYIHPKTAKLIKEQRRLIRVAIGKNGIIVDKFAVPGSCIPVSRSVFEYKNFKRCYVEPQPYSMRAFHFLGDQVKLMHQEDKPILFANGLADSQLFADKVNEMIEQVKGGKTRDE
jgi:hypothetical protein